MGDFYPSYNQELEAFRSAEQSLTEQLAEANEKFELAQQEWIDALEARDHQLEDIRSSEQTLTEQLAEANEKFELAQ